MVNNRHSSKKADKYGLAARKHIINHKYQGTQKAQGLKVENGTLTSVNQTTVTDLL